MRHLVGLAALGLVLVASAVSFAADDEGVDVSFVDNGGVMYKVRPPGFSFNLDPDGASTLPTSQRDEKLTAAYGKKTATEIAVPRSNDWPVRNGCFARTKYLPVAHAKGKAQAFPEFDISWSTTVRDPAAPKSDDSKSPALARMSSADVMDETLLRFQIEVRKPNGTVTSSRAYINPGILDLSDETRSGTAVTYKGSLRNTGTAADDKTVGLVNVDEGDEVRFALCDVRADAKVTLKSVRILTFPLSSN
jgi:hypothetical protein